MTGDCIVIHQNGWGCSNEAKMDADKEIVEIDGKKFSKSIITLKLNSIFDTIGKVSEGQSVECLFKSEDGKKNAFVGTVKSRGKNTTVIHQLIKTERYTEILNKIKQ